MFKKRYFIFLICLGLIIILFIPQYYYLELKCVDNNEIVFLNRIEPRDIFILEYIHSVALTPVTEIFQVDKEHQIILIETNFLDHGAGLPYTPFEQEVFLREEGKFKIKNMQRIMPVPIYYRVGESSDNCFYFKEDKIELSSLLGEKLLTIKIIKKNNLSILWGGLNK